MNDDLAQIESQRKFTQPSLPQEEGEGDSLTSSLKRRKTEGNDGSIGQVKIAAASEK